MSSDVVLSSALRTNLLSLQKTQSNIDQVQKALSSGLKVSSALDNPQSYFAARSLNNRASDLSGLLDGIGQSISSIKQTNTAVDKLTTLVEQADSIITQAADAAADSATASVAGSADLSAVTDITKIAGVAAGNSLIIKVNNPDDANVTYTLTVALSAGDSIDQVLAKINAQGTPTSGSVSGSYNSAGEAYIQASLDDSGHLKLAAQNGGNLQVEFQAQKTGTGTAADNSVNLGFARALGFGDKAQLVDQADTAVHDAVQITAVAGNALKSGAFYSTNANNTFAQASDLLSTVNDTGTGSTKRFITSTSGTDNVSITINNATTVNIAIDQNSTTIQGLVDTINNNATLKSFVHAGYDDTTGKLSIEKISAKVQTIEIGLDPLNAGLNTGAVKADFDFGLTNLATATDTQDVSEVYSFGAGTGQIAQYEKDFNKVREQIDGLVADSPYKGANLLKGGSLETFFNSDHTTSLVTDGQDLTTKGLAIDEADFSSTQTIDSFRTNVKAALDTLRSFGGSLANDLSIIQARQDFTNDTISNLKEGADKLTVADQNEEGAKLLSLQTAQQLGVTSLSLASQAQQSVLRLF